MKLSVRSLVLTHECICIFGNELLWPPLTVQVTWNLYSSVECERLYLRVWKPETREMALEHSSTWAPALQLHSCALEAEPALLRSSAHTQSVAVRSIDTAGKSLHVCTCTSIYCTCSYTVYMCTSIIYPGTHVFMCRRGAPGYAYMTNSIVYSRTCHRMRWEKSCGSLYPITYKNSYIIIVSLAA